VHGIHKAQKHKEGILLVQLAGERLWESVKDWEKAVFKERQGPGNKLAEVFWGTCANAYTH
jgi:hypothetical protein